MPEKAKEGKQKPLTESARCSACDALWPWAIAPDVAPDPFVVRAHYEKEHVRELDKLSVDYAIDAEAVMRAAGEWNLRRDDAATSCFICGEYPLSPTYAIAINGRWDDSTPAARLCTAHGALWLLRCGRELGAMKAGR